MVYLLAELQMTWKLASESVELEVTEEVQFLLLELNPTLDSKKALYK